MWPNVTLSRLQILCFAKHSRQRHLQDSLSNFIERMASSPSWPSSAKITPMSWLSYLPLWKLGSVLALSIVTFLAKSWSVCFSTSSLPVTCVLAPSSSTEPLLQKFLKGENFASNFSISATDKSLLYLSIPSFHSMLKISLLPPSCKDSSIRHPSFPLCKKNIPSYLRFYRF